MTGFYANKENLPSLLGHYLAIFHQDQAFQVPVLRRCDDTINVEDTLGLPCYRDFPADEKKRWLEPVR